MTAADAEGTEIVTVSTLVELFWVFPVMEELSPLSAKTVPRPSRIGVDPITAAGLPLGVTGVVELLALDPVALEATTRTSSPGCKLDGTWLGWRLVPTRALPVEGLAPPKRSPTTSRLPATTVSATRRPTT
jgi:hypothetical protein